MDSPWPRCWAESLTGNGERTAGQRSDNRNVEQTTSKTWNGMRSLALNQIRYRPLNDVKVLPLEMSCHYSVLKVISQAMPFRSRVSATSGAMLNVELSWTDIGYTT